MINKDTLKTRWFGVLHCIFYSFLSVLLFFNIFLVKIKLIKMNSFFLNFEEKVVYTKKKSKSSSVSTFLRIWLRGISEETEITKERGKYMGKSVQYYILRQDSRWNPLLKNVVQTSPSITFYTHGNVEPQLCFIIIFVAHV